MPAGDTKKPHFSPHFPQIALTFENIRNFQPFWLCCRVSTRFSAALRAAALRLSASFAYLGSDMVQITSSPVA